MQSINNKSVLLPMAYLGPIQYYSKLLLYETVFIEQHENYSKQTIRNRCHIYGANGKICLSIPVRKADTLKTKIQDVLIDYDTDWQKQHWKTIESSYRNSPFFQYYEDEFAPFYHAKEKYLIDLDLKLFELLLSLLDLQPNYKLTDAYIKHGTDTIEDFRQCISEKKRLHKYDPLFQSVEYYQVFADRFSFIPNLSIIDLLFNEGMNSKNILSASIKKA